MGGQLFSIEAHDNEHKHEYNKINKAGQKNRINYKEGVNTTTKGNKGKKSASVTTKEMSNQNEEKNSRTRIVKTNIFNLLSKNVIYLST